MKKVKKIIWLSITMSVVLVCLSGCWKKIHMDEEKCAEVALEYMKSKYGKEFVLVSSSELMNINGPAGFARVKVKTAESEESYCVTVYPNGKSDKNKDGYYDSYKIISDDYMCFLVEDYAKDGMTKLLSDVGLTEFICRASMKTNEYTGAYGITSEFPIPDEGNFVIKDVLNNYAMSIYCWISIPESENYNMLQQDIENIIKPLVSNGDVTFSINIYSNEDYNTIKETDINNIENKVTEKENLYFYILGKENKKWD